jgi:benzoyl-CoA reductase/2-hydroxyglutaryl-CoA dehydratase subunit BcrC/BadD/HgdB
MEFYDNSATMKQVVAELQKQVALGTEQGNAYREREAALIGLITEHAATLQGLDAFRQQRKFVEKENESVSEVRKRKEEIEKRENEQFDSFNKKFRAAIEERNQ